MNLDHDFIDYPTAWAIVKTEQLDHHKKCSFSQTGGALLCDCNAMPTRWAELKTAHDGSDSKALAQRYLTGEA